MATKTQDNDVQIMLSFAVVAFTCFLVAVYWKPLLSFICQ